MNKNILQGSWLQLSGELKKQWGKLTDDDLKQIEGQRDRLEGTLRKRYGYTSAKASKEVDNFLEDTESRLTGLQSLLRRRVSKAQENVQDTAETVRDTAQTAAEEANIQLGKAAPDELANTVESYPWLVVTGAFVTGILIGLVLSPNLNGQRPHH